MTKLRSYLEVENVIFTSIGGTRLIGAMAVMNNKGILLSSISSDEEIEVLRRSTGLNVERLSSRFTAVGNLVSANDKGALVSPIFKGEVDKQIQDVLGRTRYYLYRGRILPDRFNDCCNRYWCSGTSQSIGRRIGDDRRDPEGRD